MVGFHVHAWLQLIDKAMSAHETSAQPVMWRAWMDYRTENTGSAGWQYRDSKPALTSVKWEPLYAQPAVEPRHTTDRTAKLEFALRGLYWDQVDYLMLNKLGGMQNHWMRAAREALGMDIDDVRPAVEPSPERRCVCGLAMIPEGELRVEVGPTTHRLAGPCFQTSRENGTRDV